jgi:hypothetical protein
MRVAIGHDIVTVHQEMEQTLHTNLLPEQGGSPAKAMRLPSN